MWISLYLEMRAWYVSKFFFRQRARTSFSGNVPQISGNVPHSVISSGNVPLLFIHLFLV